MRGSCGLPGASTPVDNVCVRMALGNLGTSTADHVRRIITALDVGAESTGLRVNASSEQVPYARSRVIFAQARKGCLFVQHESNLWSMKS